MSNSNCCFLTHMQVSQETGKVSGFAISLRIFFLFFFFCDPYSQRLSCHQWSRSKCFFLELSCFSHDPMNVGNFISFSSAFCKSSLYMWKFSIHVLLKPSLKHFEHYLASMWNEHSRIVVWTFFDTGMKTDIFQSCGHCWVFQICGHVECSSFTVSSFRIWNSSTGIPSPPLALFILMLPEAHLTSHFRMFGSRWVTTPWRLFGH